MLTLRKEQMEALQHGKDHTFALWMADQLRLEHPSLADAGNEAILPRVIAGLARGREYGLSQSYHLFQFIGAMFRHGDDFHLHPHIAPILNDSSRNPASRMDAAVIAAAGIAW